MMLLYDVLSLATGLALLLRAEMLFWMPVITLSLDA